MRYLIAVIVCLVVAMPLGQAVNDLLVDAGQQIETATRGDT